MPAYDVCECCGVKLDPTKSVWLMLDGTTNTYHRTDAEIPADHIHQDGFQFGAACARRILKQGGKPHKHLGRTLKARPAAP